MKKQEEYNTKQTQLIAKQAEDIAALKVEIWDLRCSLGFDHAKVLANFIFLPIYYFSIP